MSRTPKLRETLINKLVARVAVESACGFQNAEQIQPRSSEFYSETGPTSRIFHTQDGLPPWVERNKYLAITRFAKANRLNSCAVFFASPL